MYNLHCHSVLSDGVLLPSEIARRYEVMGYKAIAITDHVDISNIKQVVAQITEFCNAWPKNRIKVIPGIEITHVPLEQFKPLVKYARVHGIKIIVGHGETLSEPVIKGTNKKVIESAVDILAHPGLITEEEARLAKKHKVFLEVTSRSGHNQTNRHVVDLASKVGAALVIDTDSHIPEDIISPQDLTRVGLRAGLCKAEIERIYKDEERFIKGL